MQWLTTIDLWLQILIAVVTVGLIGLATRQLLKKPKAEKLPPPSSPEATAPKPTPVEVAPPPPPPRPPGLSAKMGKTRSFLADRFEKLWGGKKGAVESAAFEELEEILLEADVGVSTTSALLTSVKSNTGVGMDSMRGLLKAEIEKLFDFADPYPIDWSNLPKPLVISVVGVNGAGKTTTVGKLAHLLSQQGKTVLLGAVDTFRAAAIEQLKVWADRANAQFVSGREGADPGAVAFDAVTAGKARGADVVLLDTAGRLHTKVNLMDELKKIHRVIKKVVPEAPHQTWLVLDGTLGQNSIQQAKEFQKALDLTGVIVTKLDGTAKGGAVISVSSELKLPVRYIGVGESLEDFMPFQPQRYVEAILGES